MDTVKGCDNADLMMHLELENEPGCSTLVLRVATWDERNAGAAPEWIFERDDWISLDLNDMRELRTRLDQQIAQVEAHDAALNAAYDDDTDNEAADTAADGM